MIFCKKKIDWRIYIVSTFELMIENSKTDLMPIILICTCILSIIYRLLIFITLLLLKIYLKIQLFQQQNNLSKPA